MSLDVVCVCWSCLLFGDVACVVGCFPWLFVLFLLVVVGSCCFGFACGWFCLLGLVVLLVDVLFVVVFLAFHVFLVLLVVVVSCC